MYIYFLNLIHHMRFPLKGSNINPLLKLIDYEFNDQSLNFVYIDANHSYDSVLEDLNCWWPKLKRHGILFGDDYFSKSKEKYGVIKAVNEFTYHNKIQVHFSNQFKQYFFIKT